MGQIFVLQPEVNQIWKTKEGRLALIVRDFPENVFETQFSEKRPKPSLKMLWFDEIDGEFCVSQIFNRLEQLVVSNGDMTSFIRLLKGINKNVSS